MTVEEAREVFWIREPRRKLGELLDDGRLTEKHLSWAAKKAYDQRLREAATVLLEEMRKRRSQEAGSKVGMNFGITRQEALETLWPFRPYRGRPMGELMHSHQLSLRDLAYAVDKAWSKQVRQAAALLLVEGLGYRVEEPEERQGVLRVVVAGPSYVDGEISKRFLGIGVVIGFVLGVMVTWSIMQLIQQREHAHAANYTLEVWIIVWLLSLLIGLGYYWIGTQILDKVVIPRFRESIRRLQRGREGEERVAEIMRQVLDDQWTLFRNLKVPWMGKGDLDGVLIGPTGVWLLEIKSWSGRYLNRGEHWFYWKRNNWHKMKDDPSRQVRRNAGRLAAFLRERGVRVWVNPVIVWANPEKRLALETPAVPVWTLDQLSEQLALLKCQYPLSEETQQYVVEYLSELVTLQREEAETIV